jgi:lysophospholipase L1-like esterase
MNSRRRVNLLLATGAMLLAAVACEIEPKRTLDDGSSGGGASGTTAGTGSKGGSPASKASGGSGAGDASAGEGADSAGEAGSGGSSGRAGEGPSAGEGGAPPDEASAGDGGSETAGESGTGGTSGGSAAVHWVGTWATGPQLTETNNLPPPPGLANNTLRQVFHVSRGGSRLRLRLSNEYGDGPVTLSSVRFARTAELGAIDTATDTALSFAGSASITIQQGQIAWSDPFDFALSPLSNVSVSIHFGAVPNGVTGHPGSRTTSYLASGDNVSAADLSTAVRTDHWYFATGIDVAAEADAAAVVVLGDSLTDGRGSTTNGNDRWPDVLASRLQENPATSKVGVLNLGIGGNAVLAGGLGPTARARFDSQVLAQSGVRFLIVLEGVNDIGAASSTSVAQDLISAYQEFITKAHAAGVLAYGVPILPFGGSSYTSATRESARTFVNEWIRTSDAWDAVIDLDAAVRDSNDPSRLLAAYDSGDRLHLSPAGYRRMGEAVELALFEP